MHWSKDGEGETGIANLQMCPLAGTAQSAGCIEWAC